MTYMDCVVCAVPTANKETYLKHAKDAFSMFNDQGAESMIECWGDDVPKGKVNSLHTAVDRKPNETIVMSYIRWPSKAVRDAAWEKIMSDPDMEKMEMPFDGSRMIFGGFELLLEAS